jgi:RNA-directed DNA polymerase
MARTAKQDQVRELQRTLYRAAKADPGRRFHALHDKVYRRDVLERAWESVRANRGASGIDRITIADVEQYGVSRLLGELAADLKDGRWRPLPARRVFIPKPGSLERRPLSIPAVRDRIVQAATKTVIEPIFEADMLPCSFGFRPGRSAHDALQILIDESWRGARWVTESDVASCFESIPHDRLMTAIEERISDRHVLKLLRAMLRAGVMEDGAIRRSVSGTPQGGVISPVLCNVYLHRLDREWQTRGHGVLVRYADDLVRHEAPCDRAEMKGLRRGPVAAGPGRWGQPDLGDAREGGSSPDNDGTGWYCQTAWVRQSRRDGVTRVNQWQSPVSGVPAPNLADGPVSSACSSETADDSPGRWQIAGPEAMVKDCGVAMARLPGHSWAPPSSTGRVSERGNRLGLPSWLAIQAASGQVRRRLMTRRRGGASVVVRGRESRPHGEGRQQVRSKETGMPGGRL